MKGMGLESLKMHDDGFIMKMHEDICFGENKL